MTSFRNGKYKAIQALRHQVQQLGRYSHLFSFVVPLGTKPITTQREPIHRVVYYQLVGL
ncbi:hypothetical protein [Solitalea canadensis]|uniref:hypothetical protein n=1 Tax=Solitalea canadensis TaxID=995 RepID=UPI0012F90E68|nr:hypothetical protein [Solitalea canadensis]